jgi:hypothetical protein
VDALDMARTVTQKPSEYDVKMIQVCSFASVVFLACYHVDLRHVAGE